MDRQPDGHEALDRHALVVTVWAGLGAAAAPLFHFGLGNGAAAFTLAGFAVLLAAFVSHVIVNAVYAAAFTPRELALGLVLYGAALLAFGFAVLLSPGFGERNFLATSLGFLVFGAAVVFYMVTRFGLRQVFEAFDVVRDFRPDTRAGGSRKR